MERLRNGCVPPDPVFLIPETDCKQPSYLFRGREPSSRVRFGRRMSLFQEEFEVKDTSRKFDHVGRLHCRLAEEGYELQLDLDVNSDLLDLQPGERFALLLTSTLDLDGAADAGVYDQSGKPSLLDSYE